MLGDRSVSSRRLGLAVLAGLVEQRGRGEECAECVDRGGYVLRRRRRAGALRVLRPEGDDFVVPELELVAA